MEDEPASILSFQPKEIPNINTVGGKALSLIKLTKSKFNVPQGIILTINFFDEWMNLIKSSSNWSKLTEEIDFNNIENNLKSIIEYG